MKKKLMALLLAILFLTMMFSVGCNKDFDITGSWTLNFTWNYLFSGTETITFTGNKDSGSFTDGTDNGTYTVKGDTVAWVYNKDGTTFIGSFTDDNNMNGTFSAAGINGTWTATR